MAAHLDFNKFPNSDAEESYPLLAVLNAASEILLRFINLDKANKKSTEQQKEFNELLAVMIFITEVLNKIKLQRVQQNYLKEQLEEKEFLDKNEEQRYQKITDAQKQMAESNAIAEASRIAMNANYDKLIRDLTDKKSIISQHLQVVESKINQLHIIIAEIDFKIEQHLNKIIDDLIPNLPDLEIIFENKELSVTKNEFKEAIKAEK